MGFRFFNFDFNCFYLAPFILNNFMMTPEQFHKLLTFLFVGFAKIVGFFLFLLNNTILQVNVLFKLFEFDQIFFHFLILTLLDTFYFICVPTLQIADLVFEF